jgi:hypothetical protein
MYSLLTGSKYFIFNEMFRFCFTHPSRLPNNVICNWSPIKVYPLYDSTEEELQNKLKKGMTAFIDTRYKERSFAEAKLVEIIPLCWTYDPNQRIDIFQLVIILRKAVQENQIYETNQSDNM